MLPGWMTRILGYIARASLGKHSWIEDPEFELFKSCDHIAFDSEHEQTAQRLEEGSDAHLALIGVLENKALLSTLSKVAPNLHTAAVESYNHLKFVYLSCMRKSVGGYWLMDYQYHLLP